MTEENTQDQGAADEHGEQKEELEFLLDVPLVVSAELGRLSIKIRDLLALEIGSVLELEKLAGEPLEILVNDKLVWRGEVLVVNEKYAVRTTDIVGHLENLEIKSKSGQV